MLDIPVLLVIIVIVALIFDFTNGAHDCANAIATVVSTKVLSPRTAVLMAAALNLVGAFLGSEVAHTLGKGIVNTEVVTGSEILVLAALIGAAITHAGFASLNGMSILKKIVLPMVLSPLIGFFVSYLVMIGLLFIFANSDRRVVAQKFKKLQILSAAFMATSHGLNDAQKTMGVITLALLLFHQIDSIVIPFWVTVSCASVMALGTALGGWKIIKTMGHRISKLEPTTGFAAETSASLVITGASLIGAPISTTHTITACIFGVGSAKRLSAVRWEMAANLTVAWVTTIPASAAIAAVSFFLLKIMGIGG